MKDFRATAVTLSGERHVINCQNFNREEVGKWLNLLRTQSGRETIRLCKMWHTEHPSIQGPWSPFVNRDPELNLCEFPNNDLSRPIHIPPSATEQLIELLKQQQQDVATLDTKRAE